MLNPEALLYFDLSFDDNPSSDIIQSIEFRYCGIYNSNIILVEIDQSSIWYGRSYYRVDINIKKLPTINELKFITEQCKIYPNSTINKKMPHMIKHIMHVDDIYYGLFINRIIKPYYLKIKRIPLHVKS
jgi:hypothetical protein